MPLAVEVIYTWAFTSFNNSLALQLGTSPLLPSPVRTSLLPAMPEIPEAVMLVRSRPAFSMPADDPLLHPSAIEAPLAWTMSLLTMSLLVRHRTTSAIQR